MNTESLGYNFTQTAVAFTNNKRFGHPVHFLGMDSPVRSLCEIMRSQLEDARDRIGINMAALRMLQKRQKTTNLQG